MIFSHVLAIDIFCISGVRHKVNILQQKVQSQPDILRHMNVFAQLSSLWLSFLSAARTAGRHLFKLKQTTSHKIFLFL